MSEQATAEAPITIEEMCRMRFADVVNPLTEATQAHYWRSLRQYEKEFLGRKATIHDLNAESLVLWARSIQEAGYAPATANSRVKQLRALWDWAARKRMIEEFPPRGVGVREPAYLPEAWSAAELKAIFQACERQTGYIGPHKAADFWTGFHWWLFNTGERTGATLLLRPSMVNLKDGTARVPANIRKGNVRPMVYKLSPRGLAAMERVLSRSDEVVFCTPWKDVQCLYRHYRALIEDAGIEHQRHKTGPQKMRRTVATMVAALGGNAQYYLGHAARSTADESYLDRTFLMAHDGGIWPTDDLDPLGKKAWLPNWFKRGG